METTKPQDIWYAHRDLHHPLETMPFFRRFKRGLLRDFLFTLIFNALIAVFFTALASMFSGGPLDLVKVFRINFIISNCIGFTMGYALQFLTRFLSRRKLLTGKPSLGITLLYMLVSIGCTLIGYAIAAAILGWSNWRVWLFTPRNIAVISVFCMAISVVVLLVMQASHSRLQSESSAATAEAELERSRKDLATAELKTLRAQVEPHFLYNSLAHVTTLIDQDPAKAKLMVERLIALLRSNVEGSRDNVSTLGRELSGVENYLGILKIRMGARLEFSVNADDAARNVIVPPMVLQPLVENAIKHGIEPKIAGGQIEVEAHVVGNAARIEIRDNGLGFGAANTASTGTGLANLKARLKATCGDKAKLAIGETPGGGVTITLILPTGQ
jgi:sensor histidine kinase YesM